MTGIALLGAGFIGQMHSLSLRLASFSRQNRQTSPELLYLLELEQARALGEEVRSRYGWKDLVLSDWEIVVTRPEIELFINAGPNNAHGPATIAAARAGKAVFCEKPLAAGAEEAFSIWQEAERAKVLHACAFIHRFVPALRLARNLIAAGELGEVRHFRSQFLLDMEEPTLNWRFSRGIAGGGATGDLGSHHIDAARFLVGEVKEISAATCTWTRDFTGRVTDLNDDAFSAFARLENGALATFEASRVAPGHTVTGRIEIDGSKGTLAWSLERLNELTIREKGKGVRTVLATRQGDPYADFFLPIGIQGAFPVSWRDCFVHQVHHLLQAIEAKTPVNPDGATFRDGYRVAEIVDAMLRSAESGHREPVEFKA